MHLISSRFIAAAVALMVVCALAQLFYYFRFKRNLNVTEIDKQLWQLRLFSAFLGLLLLMAMFYLPTTGIYRDVDLSPAASEAPLQTIVHNQQRVASELDQMRDVLNVVFMVSGLYLFGIGTFIARVWSDKQKRAAANDPKVQKPLGLAS